LGQKFVSRIIGEPCALPNTVCGPLGGTRWGSDGTNRGPARRHSAGYYTRATHEYLGSPNTGSLSPDLDPLSAPYMTSHVIKILVSLGLLALIAYHVDLREVFGIISHSNPWLLLPALLLQIASFLLAAFRWHMIMRALQFDAGLPFFVRSYLKGTFFNQALPTSIGGDALRVLEAGRLGRGKRESFYGVFIDRIIGLVGLLVLNLAAVSYHPLLLQVRPEIHYVIVGIAVLGILGMVVLAFLGKLHLLSRNRITRLLFDLSNRVRTVYHNFASVSEQLVLSVLIHLLAMLAIFLVGLSVGLDYSLFVYLVIVPPVILLTIIPISLAGWGVREGAMIGLFTLIGAQRATVLSMSVLYGLLLIVASMPGMYYFLLARHKKEIAQ
jgi:uncharacterized protein (TIRG00374 family)